MRLPRCWQRWAERGMRTMQFDRFSPKQRTAMCWWSQRRYSGYDAIICDGAVRSGKTLSMSIGFVSWAMSTFRGGSFALCGKTVTALKRNVMTPLVQLLGSLGFTCLERVSKNYVDISLAGITNRFYLFGGRDESSAALIQGMTLCGVFLDEVALMPRSFVEQAVARCSVTGSRLWFNCNPDHPYHWFYREWICKAAEKNALYLHFTMADNPSLSAAVRRRYERLYTGAFYERFVLGKWTAADGQIYPMFSEARHVVDAAPECDRFVISCDYGTVNPASFGLWGHCDGIWYRIREYYYDSRKMGQRRTDEEHYAALEQLAGDIAVECVVIDPSAASMIACIQRHGRFRAIPANNEVLTGIQLVSDLLQQDKLRFCRCCADIRREFQQYCWNDSAAGDAPRKEHDHAMDDMRYFVSTVVCRKETDSFCVLSTARTQP